MAHPSGAFSIRGRRISSAKISSKRTIPGTAQQGRTETGLLIRSPETGRYVTPSYPPTRSQSQSNHALPDGDNFDMTFIQLRKLAICLLPLFADVGSNPTM